MMTDFLHLFSATAHCICTFLCTIDVVHLDSAVASRTSRRYFHSALARNCIADLTFRSASASWIIKRNVLPTKVVLERFVLGEEVLVLSQMSSHVREIEQHEPTISIKALKDFIGCCPNLEAIQYHHFSISTEVYVALVTSTGTFTKFAVQGRVPQYISPHALRDVLQRSPKLVHIDISGCPTIMANGPIRLIAEHCPQVQSIVASNMHQIDEGELLHLATSCTSLREIHFRSEGGQFIPGMSAFVQNCSSTLRVVDLQHTTLIGSDLVALARRCRMLTELHMVHCHMVENELASFATFVALCPMLHTVVVSCCSWFTNEFLHALAARPKLRCLRFDRIVTVTMQCLANMVALWPCLEELVAPLIDAMSMRGSVNVLRNLGKHCPRLRVLNLYCSDVAQADVDFLTNNCTQLHTLQLTFNPLQQTESICCSNSANLRELSLYNEPTLFDEDLLLLVSTCPKLRAIRMTVKWPIPYKCRDVRIVQTIARQCPFLRDFWVSMCSTAVWEALVALQAQRSSEKRKFSFNATRSEPWHCRIRRSLAMW